MGASAAGSAQPPGTWQLAPTNLTAGPHDTSCDMIYGSNMRMPVLRYAGATRWPGGVPGTHSHL